MNNLEYNVFFQLSTFVILQLFPPLFLFILPSPLFILSSWSSISPSKLNAPWSQSPPPPPQPLQLCIPPCWCQLLNEVRRARVCVHVCAKGSGSVARTMGTSTAFCSDTLSPEPCSKHHGKTIKSFSKPLLLCVCFARSLCPSVPLSLHLPVPPSPSRPLFEDLRSGLSLFLNWKQIFSFPPEMSLIGRAQQEWAALVRTLQSEGCLLLYTCI